MRRMPEGGLGPVSGKFRGASGEGEQRRQSSAANSVLEKAADLIQSVERPQSVHYLSSPERFARFSCQRAHAKWFL